MAKEPWSKGRINKIKNSPAAKMRKEQGTGAVFKTLGGMIKEGAEDLADKTMDTLFPGDTSHGPASKRSDEWNHGLHSHMGKDSTCATCAIDEMRG